jgi:hypothetical protein
MPQQKEENIGSMVIFEVLTPVTIMITSSGILHHEVQ